MIARFAEYHTDFRALVMFFVYENASYAGTTAPQRGTVAAAAAAHFVARNVVCSMQHFLRRCAMRCFNPSSRPPWYQLDMWYTNPQCCGFHLLRFFLSYIVQKLWEGHIIWKNLPPFFWNFLLTSKQFGRWFQNDVAFSEYFNFTL